MINFFKWLFTPTKGERLVQQHKDNNQSKTMRTL